MKKILFFLFIFVTPFTGYSQTATNFSCNDCSGASHDLFTELNEGKVIVLCWVMPCASCIPSAKTSYNIVNSFQTSNPNRVFFYLVDDYADTQCSSLSSWANTNSIPESSFSLRFSNSIIKMTDYGTTGMPKVVVIGGNSHSVFYNVNGSVNAANLQTAISNALASPYSVEDRNSELFNISIFPTPSNNQTSITINLNTLSNVTIDLYNMVGNKVSEIFDGPCNSGNNEIKINTSDLSDGIYFVKASVSGLNKTLKLIVSH